MLPERLNIEQALAVRKKRFDGAAAHLRANGVNDMARQLKAEEPGIEVSVREQFKAEEPLPSVSVQGLKVMRESYKGEDGVIWEEWTQASVVVRSDGISLQLSRWETQWIQKSGDQSTRKEAYANTPDIPFDPQRGVDLLRQGLASDRLFREPAAS